MPGGLMSLLAVGAQDQYLTASPEISYFKQVIKRTTNFSMESLRQVFLTKPTLDTSSVQSFTCRIGRHGDLLGDIFLCFTLPAIYSDGDPANGSLQFRWIRNLANHMITRYYVSIDTQIIDERWGDWMDVWNELSMPNDKKYGYDSMIGNVEEFTGPRDLRPRVIVHDNRLIYNVYPNSTQASPSIASRTFYVPLDFWFTKNPAVALPLVALQYQNIDVTIEFRNIEQLYQVWDTTTAEYISPSRYRSLGRQRDVSITRFLSHSANVGQVPSVLGSIDLNAYLECNFYFLDTPERSYIAAANTDYIIDRVYRSHYYGLAKGANIIELILSNPVKEIVWVLRRSDMSNYNDWHNFTAHLPMDGKYSTLESAKIMWNGVDRFEEKPAAYFNCLQPYQFHTTSPRPGIYAYSFSMFPEKMQPSGSFNASMISKIDLSLNTVNYASFDNYECIVYSLYYNVFRVMGGSGGMVFAN